MEMLRSTKKTTEDFTVKLQELKNKYKVDQSNIKEKILSTSQEQIRKIRNNNNEETDGNPTEFCHMLTKLKIDFDQLKIDQKQEEKKLMEKYVEQMINNMNIESVKKINSVDLSDLTKEEAQVLPGQGQGMWYINKMNEIKVRVFESMVNSTTPGWEPIYEEIGKQLKELSPQLDNYKVVYGPINQQVNSSVKKKVVKKEGVH